MKITQVSYEACFNLGDYENEKIRLSAQLGEGDTVDTAVQQLREQVIDLATPSAYNTLSRVSDAKRELRSLEEKIKQRTQEWNNTAEFLRKQGINAEAVDMPMFSNLLAPAKPDDEEVKVEVLDDDIPL